MREVAPNPHTQPLGLLFEERAGSPGADFVHLEIGKDSIADGDELRILSADFENRLHIGMVVRGGDHLCGDLIANHVGPKQFRGEVPAAAGGAGGQHHNPVAEAPVDAVQAFTQCLERAAAGRQINALKKAELPVEDDKVGANRADVEAEEGLDKAFRRGFFVLHGLGRRIAAPKRGQRRGPLPVDGGALERGE